MVRAQRTQLNLLVAAFVAGTVAIACGGDKKDDDGVGGGGDTAGGGGDTAGTGGSEGALTIAFNPMYSAFDDNAHDFKVPVKVTGHTGKLTVKTSPDGFVSSEPSTDGVMLTTKKSGKCTVTITDEKGNTGSASLTVTQNEPTDVDIGKERYANGIDAFNLPEGGIMFPEGGFMLPEGGLGALGDGGIRSLFGDGGFPRGGEGGLPSFGIMRNDMAACTFCHIPDGQQAPNSMIMQIDVEHTPQQTAGYSDDDLINIFTMAKKPPGAPFRIVNGGGLLPDTLAQRAYESFHKWNVAPETQKGLVAYLRSLTPKAQENIDFGGLLRGGIPGGGRAGGGAAAGGTGAMDAGAP